MTKLPFAFTALAVATVSTLALSTSADAGGRGGHHFRFHHFHFSPPVPVPEPTYVHRAPRVIVKRSVASTPAPAPVKYADEEGRQYDRASKTWFDGAGTCWKGSKGFSYRSGGWFYGTARWVQTSNGWGVSAGEVPEQVDCSTVKAFAAKTKPVSKVSEAQAVEAPKPAIETPKPTAAQPAPVRTVAPAPVADAPKAPDTTANASDCKKYLPSLGETVSVPCT
jgi:hypothetical protein